MSEYAKGSISARAAGLIEAGDRVPAYSRPLDELPAPVQREATRRRHYVQALLELGSFVFMPSLQPMINEVATRIGDEKRPSLTTLYRWYVRYRRNNDTRALIPRTDLRGSPNLKQGDEIIRLATQAIQEAYGASPLATGQSVYTRLIAKIEAENRQRVASDHLKRPSLRSVYRMLERVEAYDHAVLKDGKAAADKRFRINKMGVKTSNILERAESDHTPLDLFLIDEKTWLPLGRPTLTVIIDHFSRMLLGYYLTFDSPSTAAVMGAFRALKDSTTGSGIVHVDLTARTLEFEQLEAEPKVVQVRSRQIPVGAFLPPEDDATCIDLSSQPDPKSSVAQ